jgi:hypothetical protein
MWKTSVVTQPNADDALSVLSSILPFTSNFLFCAFTVSQVKQLFLRMTVGKRNSQKDISWRGE